ncbi:hypothetical protein BUALT_Bualt15G0109000 [Buddleja alternifolia]|uniref:C3H1-type domain-containing protein n=1 Tax=Buddleja alternifolia TaxID=168488 RepID=A0AAV6WPW0_9LAMI|nr:hypothetical protein BUALT_Bualt15G0109000 [Buddleja alternifolia]
MFPLFQCENSGWDIASRFSPLIESAFGFYEKGKNSALINFEKERRKWGWGNITAIIATNNSRTPPWRGGATSKVSPTRKPKLSGTTPSGSHPNQVLIKFITITLLAKEFAIALSGSCQYGDSCKYYHPKKNAPNMNTQGTEAAIFGNQMGTSLGNLPPSLWPPPEGGYPPLPFVDWG